MFYIKKIFFILSFSHFIIKKKEEKENEKKIFFLWFYLNSIMWSDKAEGERYIGTSFSYVRHTPRHGNMYIYPASSRTGSVSFYGLGESIRRLAVGWGYEAGETIK